MTELSATGHTPRVVEHLRRWGLLQRVRDAWTYPPEWHRGTRLVTSPAWHEPAPVPAPSFTERGGAVGHSSDEALRRPQTVFQRVFLDHLTEQGVSVSGGWELTAVRGDTDGVDAEVVNVDSGRSHTMRAAYVLGTDGGSSTTRRLAGIGRAGEHATEKRLRLIVRTGDISDRVGPAPSATNIVVNSRASGFLAAVSAREWRVYDGPYPLDHEPGEDELLEVGRAAFGFDAPTDEVQRAPGPTPISPPGTSRTARASASPGACSRPRTGVRRSGRSKATSTGRRCGWRSTAPSPRASPRTRHYAASTRSTAIPTTSSRPCGRSRSRPSRPT